MKLYATVTSERASKGQGGNDYLNIKIYGKNQSQLCWIKVEEDNLAIFSNDNEVLDIVEHGTMAIIKIKAKKDKEQTQCTICGDDIYGLVQVHHHNENCTKCGEMIIANYPHNCEKHPHNWDNYGKCVDCGKWNYSESGD